MTDHRRVAEWVAAHLGFIFGTSLRPFGSPSLSVVGWSDGAQGLSRTPAVVGRGLRRNRVHAVADRYVPASRTRRPAASRSRALVAGCRPHPRGLEPRLLACGWTPAIREGQIRPAPISLATLRVADCLQAVRQALECLAARHSNRGRATQVIPLAPSGRRESKQVSSHLSLTYSIDFSRLGYSEAVRNGCEAHRDAAAVRLGRDPLHRTKRARQARTKGPRPTRGRLRATDQRSPTR
jgi:hypothetical protein